MAPESRMLRNTLLTSATFVRFCADSVNDLKLDVNMSLFIIFGALNWVIVSTGMFCSVSPEKKYSEFFIESCSISLLTPADIW